MFLPVRLLVVLIAALLSCGSAYGADKREGIPPLLTGLQLERSLTFCGETVPLDDSDVLERMERSCCCPFGTGIKLFCG